MDSAESPNLELEMSAMSQLSSILGPLDNSAKRRVLRWAADAFAVGLSSPTHLASDQHQVVRTERQPAELSAMPGSFTELIELSEPSNNADRAMIAGFWLQEVEGRESFDGRSINKLLKGHGIDVSNVTNALNSLISRKPRLAIQAGKKGKFEKLYRLTTEGRKAALALMSNGE